MSNPAYESMCAYAAAVTAAAGLTGHYERRVHHTHRIDVAFGDYHDSLLVTPPADVTDLEAWARGHVNVVRGPTQWTVTIAPLEQ